MTDTHRTERAQRRDDPLQGGPHPQDGYDRMGRIEQKIDRMIELLEEIAENTSPPLE